MLKFKGQVRFIRFNELILIEKIKLDHEKIYHSFPPQLRVLCLHLEKLQKVKPFKKFHTMNFSFSKNEFSHYYDNRYTFKGIVLPSEHSPVQIGLEDRKFYEDHLRTCSTCSKISFNDGESKSIRKRNKLNPNNNKTIMKELNISKQTVVAYKRKLLLDNHQTSKKQKKGTHISVTLYEQNQILEHVKEYPFDHPKDIKRELQLECVKNTVKNVLANSNVNCYKAIAKPLINANQFNLKKQWSSIMRKLDQRKWNQIVFSDEKTLQNYNNGTVKCIESVVNRLKITFTERH